MDKSCKSVIDAGIVPDELNEILGGVRLDSYLSEFPSQNVRYLHLSELALLRNDYDLAEYFREKSGLSVVDWCD